VSLDLIQTMALAGVVLFAGYFIRRFVTPLARYSIPAPVIGGLLVSVLLTVNRLYFGYPIALDTTLQSPLMVAFFTSIGFAASFALLRVGGPAVLIFFGLATAVVLIQNAAGAGVAMALGQPPLMGVLAGSVTMTGGPATALAFAPFFEQKGVPAAAALGVAAAMAGIVAGGLFGGPVGTYLVGRSTRLPGRPTPMRRPAIEHVVEVALPEPPATKVPEGEDAETYDLLKALVLILVAMWFGTWVSRGLIDAAASAGFRLTLPAYIGAMLVAALFRNIDDITGVFGLSQRVIDDLGHAALSLFLVMALMNLPLEQLVGGGGARPAQHERQRRRQ
jgi:glutamate:Na+ symporter, ESS family